MKGYEHKNLEVESNTDLETRSIGIADTAFIFDILFNQMYRDPIGSVIREITSNCFDSHIEAKVDDAVVIEFGDDEGGDYITFTDVGVGLSPERMDKVYKNAGTSTKRDTQDQIGYFGLGSKSPLAYDESFFLTTNFNGIKYEYIIHRGSGKSPEIQTIDSNPTEDRNGTTVKIYIKNHSDKQQFHRKLSQQLRYFDNVFVKGSREFNNTYTIHIGKNFKFRPDLFREPMHICVGKVTYPIDWSKLGRSEIYLPFGLKFDIGDLPITPERESIRYISVEKEEGVFVNTVDVINEKIDALLEELEEIRGEDTIEYNNLIDYSNAKPSGYITIAGINLDVKGVIPEVKHVYTPLADIGITKVDIHPFYAHRLSRRMYRRGDLVNFDSAINIDHLKNGLVIREFPSISRVKTITLDYIRFISKTQDKDYVYFVRRANVDYKEIRELLRNIHSRNLDYSQTNKLKIWKRYKVIMESELIANSIDYHTIEIPEDFRKKWEADNNGKKVFLTKDEEFVVENLAIKVKSDRKVIVTVDKLKTFGQFVIYGFTAQEELLENFNNLFKVGEYAQKVFICKIKIKDEKFFVPLSNAINVKSFMSNNPVFKRVAAAAVVSRSPIWERRFKGNRNSVDIPLDEAKILHKVFEPVAKKVKELSNISNKVVELNSSSSEFVDEIINIATKNDWIDPEIKTTLNKVENYFKDLGLIDHISLEKEEALLVPLVEYFKRSGKPVNSEWEYLEEWQKELIEECISKVEYTFNLGYLYINPKLNYTDRQALSYLNDRKRAIVAKNKEKITHLNTILTYHGNKERVH